MVGRCIVGGCGNTVRNGIISLHRFPQETAVRRLWVSGVKTTRKHWDAPSKNALVCSAHFREGDFDPSFDLKVSLGMMPQKVRFVRRLLPNAVPTLFGRHVATATVTPKASTSNGVAYRQRQHRRVQVQVINNVYIQYTFTTLILGSFSGYRGMRKTG